MVSGAVGMLLEWADAYLDTQQGAAAAATPRTPGPKVWCVLYSSVLYSRLASVGVLARGERPAGSRLVQLMCPSRLSPCLFPRCSVVSRSGDSDGGEKRTGPDCNRQLHRFLAGDFLVGSFSLYLCSRPSLVCTSESANPSYPNRSW